MDGINDNDENPKLNIICSITEDDRPPTYPLKNVIKKLFRKKKKERKLRQKIHTV